MLVWRNSVSVVHLSSCEFFSVWLRMIHFQAFQFSTLVFFWKVPGSSATMLMYFLIEIHHFFLLNHDSSKKSVKLNETYFYFTLMPWNGPSDQGAVSNVPWQCTHGAFKPQKPVWLDGWKISGKSLKTMGFCGGENLDPHGDKGVKKWMIF